MPAGTSYRSVPQSGRRDAKSAVRPRLHRSYDESTFHVHRSRFSPLPLSDAQLAAMQLTRAEADSVFRAIANGQQSLLSDMPGGAYRITLKFPGIGHMSFSDEPLIEAAGDSVKRAAASLALTSIQAYTRAFFDKTLFGHARTLLDRPARDTI